MGKRKASSREAFFSINGTTLNNNKRRMAFYLAPSRDISHNEFGKVYLTTANSI